MARKILIAMGVSKYKVPGNDLEGPCRDVGRMVHLCGSTHGYDSVIHLVDEPCSGEAILDTIWGVRSKLQTGDYLTWYWSGHGYRVVMRGANGERKLVQCIAPWDVDFDNPKFGHLYTKLLKQALTPHPGVGAHVTAIMDCCFSGNALRRFRSGRAPMRDEGSTRRAVPKSILGPHWDIEGDRDLVKRTFGKALESASSPIVCLAACRDNETAADSELDGEPGGAFTFGLLAAHKKPGPWKQTSDNIALWLRANTFTQVPVLTGPIAKLGDPAFTLAGASAPIVVTGPEPEQPHVTPAKALKEEPVDEDNPPVVPTEKPAAVEPPPPAPAAPTAPPAVGSAPESSVLSSLAHAAAAALDVLTHRKELEEPAPAQEEAAPVEVPVAADKADNPA
jgi:hypothetical protein